MDKDNNIFDIELYSLNITNITNIDESFKQHQATRIIQIVYCFTIFSTGIIGNTMVCVVLFRKRKMQTPLNVFLITLAIGDILFCIFYIVTLPMYHLYDSWILGETLCFVTIFVAELYEFYSIITISISMCLFLCQKVNLKKAYITISIIFLCTTLISLAKVSFTKLILFDEQKICIGEWSNHKFAMAYQLLKFLFHILLPIVTLIVFSVLSFILKFNKNPFASRLLMLIMIIYVLLSCPLILLHMFPYSENRVIDLFALFHHLSILTVVYKPILYYKMDKTMKNEFLELCLQYLKRNPTEAYNLN